MRDVPIAPPAPPLTRIEWRDVMSKEKRQSRLRAMYAGGHPTEKAKAIHRCFVHGPLPRLLPIAAVLRVRGRNSGSDIDLPLAIVPYRRAWYLVSMLEATSNWVQNVRAAGGQARLLHGRWRDALLVEVPIPERAPILKRYLLFAWSARAHFSVDWRAPIDDFEGIAPLHPVFRVDPLPNDRDLRPG
jgi:hypothetical protein